MQDVHQSCTPEADEQGSEVTQSGDLTKETTHSTVHGDTVWVEGLVPGIDFCNHDLKPIATWEVDGIGLTTGVPVSILIDKFPLVMAKGGQCLFEMLWRCIRTVFFVIALVVSLVVTSLPVVVAVVDVLVPCVLISNFTCVKCYGFMEHFRRYSFKSSLTDIPLVSLIEAEASVASLKKAETSFEEVMDEAVAYGVVVGAAIWNGEGNE